MTALRLSLAAVFAVMATTWIGAADKAEKADNDKLLVGKWEVTKASDELPVGAVMEYTKDGKIKVTFKQGDKETILDGKFTVDGDKMKWLFKPEDEKHTIIIQKITESELKLQDDEKNSWELKRIP